MSGVTINGKKYDSIEDYMEEINPIIVEPEHIEDWDYVTESDGTITLNGYKGSDKKVVIPNYINGIPVKKLGFVFHNSTGHTNVTKLGTFWDPSICKGGLDVYWYIQNDITDLVISNGIETIGKFSFFHSEALTKVVIPKSVKTIDNNAFSNCTALTDITIPDSVTSIGNSVFSSCTALTEITIPDSVASIGDYAFNGCAALTDITIPSSVIAMGEGVFGGIPSITVHVPWKEGEKPDGWDDKWNSTSSNCKIKVVYAE